jgi:hypothetical protein
MEGPEMPYIIRPRKISTIAAGLFSTLFLIGAVPAAASAAACPSNPTSQMFKQFADNAEYSLVQGGSFEAGAPGWSLTNSAIVSGNESYKVAGGSHSLAIQPNGEAVTPAFCVSIANPSFRFFARQTSGSWAVLNTILRWTDSSGTTHDTTVAALQTGTSWTVSPVMKLASTLPLWQLGSTLSVKIVFKPEQYGGAWAIDDVYIDPYRR